MHILLSLLLCTLLAAHGLQKRSLSPSGAVASFLIGLITFTHPDAFFAVVLVVFFLSSSSLTKYKAERKKRLEEDFKEGGQRTAIQVFANGLTGTALCAAHWYLVRYQRNGGGVCFGQAGSWLHSVLVLAYIGHYACCNGDTWASELGILAKGSPTLITTLRKVPPGTNGGVSSFGLAASVLGGTLIGLTSSFLVPWDTTCAGSPPYVTLVVAGAVFGLLGSLIDSVLGATLQRSVYNVSTKKIAPDHRTLKPGEKKEDLKHICGVDVLDNHQVNFVSSLMTAVIAGWVGYVWV